ncbi:MAG: hypothetical protein QOK05_2655 [Chloroflexota bacterium]|jgi:NADH dehydrogenase|nr:hypothetical protein [Chloroflexota bacterium]
MILVTGANGYVGRHVVARLASGGRQVRAMVREPGSYTPPAGVEVVQADVTLADTLSAAVAGIEAIVHAAAITANLKEPYKGAYLQINQAGTANLATAAAAAGVGRIVLVSGLGTRPAPEGTYMATRWGMEEAVRGGGLPYVILQPSVQFGDGAEFSAALARLAATAPVMPAMSGPHDKFQPIWVEDVVSCVVRALDDDALLGREIAIGGPDYLTFREILQATLRAAGKKRLLAPMPVALARVAATFMSVLPRPPLTRATLELFTFENATDLDAVKRDFGFEPRPFRQHLEEHGLNG